MSWIQRLFTRQSRALADESVKWKRRARAARRAGHHTLAADCDVYSMRFAAKQQQVVASAREAHLWHLEHTEG